MLKSSANAKMRTGHSLRMAGGWVGWGGGGDPLADCVLYHPGWVGGGGGSEFAGTP